MRVLCWPSCILVGRQLVSCPSVRIRGCLPIHRHTGRFMVFANGKKHSGLLNFDPKSSLPFAQISSFYRSWKTAAKAWSWYQRWVLIITNGTRISAWNIPSGKSENTFSHVPLLQEIFLWKDPKSRFHLLFKRTSRKRLVHGKQPVAPAVTKTDSFHRERNLNIDWKSDTVLLHGCRLKYRKGSLLYKSGCHFFFIFVKKIRGLEKISCSFRFINGIS